MPEKNMNNFFKTRQEEVKKQFIKYAREKYESLCNDMSNKNMNHILMIYQRKIWSTFNVREKYETF